MSKIQLYNVGKNYIKVKKLYKEAFPKNERIPIFVLKFLSKKGKADFFEIYDDTKFVGIMYNVYYKDIVFVFYLAIDNQFRGQGYGSKVLDLIKERHSENRIILNIEQINEKFSNNKQRIKRKEFYEKNDFKSLNFFVKEGNEYYEMLCYNKYNLKVTKEDYENLIENFLGKFLYKIYKKISE